MEKLLFYDESNTAVEFIIEGRFTLDETDYVALLPVEEPDGPIYLLKVDIDGNGDELFIGIEDDELEIVREAYEEFIEEQ